MSEPSESYVLCEGYHDRAFWAGLLLHLRCTDARLTLEDGSKGRAIDPWKKPVAGGNYGYISPSPRNGFIRVVPVGGKEKIIPAATSRLIRAKGGERLDRLIINVDSDQTSEASHRDERSITLQSIATMLRKIGENQAIDHVGDFRVLGDQATISLIQWGTNDRETPGIPRKNTLEKIICSALNEAMPDCGLAVHRWLDERPSKPERSDPKEHAWSWLAGWYAERGSYEGFCSMLWGKQEIAALIVGRLQASGAWPSIERLVA